VIPKLKAVLAWYLDKVYGSIEGLGTLPFYCDRKRIGNFAVSPSELAAGRAPALFKLFVGLAMFQARRDVVIMRQQAAMSPGEARHLLSMREIGQLALRSRCELLSSTTAFDEGCSVRKMDHQVDCAHHPGAPCHVKDATFLLNRMGDMGKLPTSAWLHAWKDGQLSRLLKEVQAAESDPQRRAALLVGRFSRIYRVGVKLSTLFVSALSTPALAPGLSPWFPAVDGNALVVVDTHVARAVDLLSNSACAATYESRARFIRERARAIDLREFAPNLPSFSPRLVQQALYSFCSKSNRIDQRTDCSVGAPACKLCVPVLCPFT
jgi:hypothetical protein